MRGINGAMKTVVTDVENKKKNLKIYMANMKLMTTYKVSF